MARRFIGNAVIEIKYLGHIAGRDEYRGRIRAGPHTWSFNSLYAPQASFSFAYNSPKAYDRMAESAISFGGYYTSHNRGDDVPEWAPSPKIADAINEAANEASSQNGRYLVRRKK